MNQPTIVMIALVTVIGVGTVFNLSIGALSLAAAGLIGIFSFHLSVPEIVSGFPLAMFWTLIGTTALFGVAQRNGTLALLVSVLIPTRKRNAIYVPFACFSLALFLAAIGAGNIVATALLAAPAMSLALRMGISPALMALMVANGANAGSLSPFAAAGIITLDKLRTMKVEVQPEVLFGLNVLANCAVAAIAFMVFQGWRIANVPDLSSSSILKSPRPTTHHLMTLATILVVLLLAASARVPLGTMAFLGMLMLNRLNWRESVETLRDIPWETILMVSGVMTLISLFERTDGVAKMVNILLENTSGETIVGVIAIGAGVLSVFSSSSGVVLPTMLPLVPGFAAVFTDVGPTPLTAAIVIGAHIVDVSPFSTLGALCIAAVPSKEMRKRLQVVLIAWSLCIALVGGIICNFVLNLRVPW